MLSPDDDFQYFVRNPLQWSLKGQTLYWAAKYLFDKHVEGWDVSYRLVGQGGSMSFDDGAMMMLNMQMFEPAGMLAGFAIEVTIKAAIVARHPESIIPGMRSEAWTGGTTRNAHDLEALASHAQVDPIDPELLRTLTKFSIWKGRYPSNMQGTATMYGMASEFENFGGTFWLEFPGRLEHVYFGIRDQVNGIISQHQEQLTQ